MKRILSVLSLLVISSATLLAQSGATGSDTSTNATESPSALTKHLLKGTYVSSGFGPALIAGFTNIDAANTVVCPGTSGNCLIVADQVMQIGVSNAAGNRVAVCFFVDGGSVDVCPFNGDTLTDGHFATYSYSHGITVPHGNHTVQTIVYTDFGATGANYTFQYRVYKP